MSVEFAAPGQATREHPQTREIIKLLDDAWESTNERLK
jgi:hypothetical protein